MKSHLYYLLFLLTVFSCKSSDPEALAQNTFKIGDKEYTFIAGYYDDYGYDSVWNEYNIEFFLLPIIAKSTTSEEDIEFSIWIDVYSEGIVFKSGVYKPVWSESSRGDFVFVSREDNIHLEEGEFQIEVKGDNNYTISVDGILEDKRVIKGSFSGKFVDIESVYAENALRKVRKVTLKREAL